MLRFDKQPSFELGVIAFAMCTGSHPVKDREYIVTQKNTKGYTAADLTDLPDAYPAEFNALVRSLAAFEPGACTCAHMSGVSSLRCRHTLSLRLLHTHMHCKASVLQRESSRD